ncbi:MAG: NACHT domain-containing protein [Bacteroidaceae bacterium]|nr:NACHT domain-containing protein [Bacteroidaceae bacterium]
MIAETAAIEIVAKPLVSKLVEKLVAPKIEQFSKWCKENYNELLIPKAEHFQEYLERSYAKYSIVNTLVFHNSQRLLKEIYVAQTIVKEHQFEDDKETTKIDKLPVSLIEKYKKILITDTAGMGKSTIMKRMFIDLIDKGLSLVGIPVYIELNKLNKKNTILDEIQETLSSLSEKFDNDLLLKFIQTGGFVFFLDGFDEISKFDRIEVTTDIQNFISKAGANNYFILTSRPESSLSSFGDFQAFKIQPLTKEESFELLKKYDLSKKKELSGKLVELLKSGQYDALNEYLVNPLLVSLLFTAYDFNRSIPFEKHRFYGVVFEAYFEKHDNTKPIKTRDKLSGLNYDGFDRILRYIGYDSLIRIGVKFNEDTILNSIRKAKEYCVNLDFSESDFLKDLTSSVPLFCKEGTDYKWAHKSLLEYFAARFIYCDAKDNQDRILSAIYNSDHVSEYLNMLDLYYDIDNYGFTKNIELPLIKEYIDFYKKNYFESSQIKKEYIEERIGYLYANNTCIASFDMNISTDDILGYYKKLIKDEFDFSINTLTITSLPSPKFVIGSFIQPQREIMSMMSKKEFDLFKLAKQTKIKNKEGFSLSLNKIDVHTGEEDENTYKIINKLLMNVGWHKRFPYFLNYQMCCKELNKLDKIINRNKDSISFLEGI